MKKSFLVVALTALIATFFGCSNLLETNAASGSAVSKMPVQISLKTDSARYIAATEWSLADITNWTVKFIEETTSKTEIGYWDAENNSKTHEEAATINVTYDKTNKVFGMSKVATGTYTLEITGTDAQSTYAVYGKLTGFVIDANDKTSKSMIVDLKKNATGSLNLTFNSGSDSLTLSTDLAGKIQAELTPLTGDKEAQTFTLDSSAEAAAFYVSSDEITTLKLNVSSLTSGFYKLTFTDLNTPKGKYSVSSDCQIVEIADDVTTMKDVKLYYGTQKNYYATNDSSNVAYNGLSASSPKKINTLLAALENDFDEYSYINIYMNSETPVLSASAVKELQDVLAAKQQIVEISVYKNTGDSNPVFKFNNDTDDDSSYKVTTSIKGDVTVKAEDGVSSLTVTSVDYSGNDGLNLKLVDGASVTVEESFSGTTNLSAETSAEEDNLSAYAATPMLTIKTTYTSTIEISSESYKARFDTTSTDVGTVTSVYAQLVGSGTTSITSFAENASIAATASDGTNYTTAIPYSSDTVTFSLSGVTSEITAYSWLLNGDTVGSDSTMSLTPTKSNYVKLDETNTVSLSVLIDGTWYYSEFTFTFYSTDYSRAVYVTNSNNYTFNEIEYNNAEAEGTSLGSISIDYHPAFTFDDSQNLWIASANAENQYLCLTKVSKSVTGGSFNTSPTQWTNVVEFTDDLSTLDITYDTVNKLIYVLATTFTSTDNASTTKTYTSTVYAFNPATFTEDTATATKNVTIDTSAWSEILTAVGVTSVVFTKIAVNGTTAYLADEAYNVFKITNFTILSSVVNLKSNLNITDTTGLTLTDIQIGDGLGGDTGNLYVLMRQVSSTVGDLSSISESHTFYSRGALCKIDSTNTVTSYGSSTTTKVITKSNSNTITFYTPGESPESVEFYGPVCFAAVCPKKLVIADDGFYCYTDSNNSNYLANKDGFLEFDINAESNQLSRTSANVTITDAPYASLQ